MGLGERGPGLTKTRYTGALSNPWCISLNLPKEGEWWNGRHEGLKIPWVYNPCGFNSHLAHQLEGKVMFNSIDIVNLAMLIVYLVTAYFIYDTLKEHRKLAYIQFYEMIKRHHTEEITDLRRTVMRELPTEVEKAKSLGRPLVEVNPDIHLKASALANYYEGLGMFLQGGWNLFPNEAKETMLAMLHNSVSRTWPLFDKYRDTIYPDRPKDWAQSYQWLFNEAQNYRAKKGLSGE